MKKTNKILSILMAFVMFFALTVPAVKAATTVEPVTKQVILHKLLMTDAELAAWDPDSITEEKYDGTQSLQDLRNALNKQSLKEIAGVYFAFQNESGKWVNSKGEEVLKAENALGGLTTDSGLTLDTSTLPAGNYQIVEVKEKSTYIGPNGETLTGEKAVPVMITLPMYNSKGLVEVAQVYPKNSEEKPLVDKDFEGLANAEKPRQDKKTKNYTVGESVPYEVQTIIPKDAKYATARWSDQMTEGLTFNKDVKVKLNDTELVAEDYKVTSRGNGFDLELTAAGLAKVNGQDTTQKIVINYSATLNSAAVVEIPESNDVTFNYGNNPDHGNTPIPTKPLDGSITAIKTWADGVQLPAEGVLVTFTLYNAQTGEVVGEPKVVKATNTDQITVTFNGLDIDTEYKVVETYNGYSAEYSLISQGQVGVKNYKDNNPKPINPEEPKVETYGKKFVKTGDGEERLQGAQFVVQNEEGKFLARKTESQIAGELKKLTDAKAALTKAIADYNANTDEAQKAALLEAISTAQNDYDSAFISAKTGYVWVNTQGEALVITSNSDGQFEVTGLKEGTYKLVEIAAPEGYAKLQNPVEFEIAKGSYESGNIQYSAMIRGIVAPSEPGYDAQNVINKKVTIPQTGGIGTLVFTLAGIALMGVAVVVLIKNNKKEELN